MGSISPRVVLVAGISCSGKTTLAQHLTDHFSALHLSMDDYYRGFNHLAVEDRKSINFDAPESVEHELLFDQLSILKAGLPIRSPRYDHEGFARLGYTHVEPEPIVVVEGLFSLYWDEVRSLADFTVFVDTPVSVCMERRLFRDTVEFNRSRDDSLRRYLQHVMPNQDQYVLPTRSPAALILEGEDVRDQAIRAVEERLFLPETTRV